MSDALTPFMFDDAPVRSLTRDGDPWFVAADVCRCLGITNPSKAVSSLDDDEKDSLTLSEGIPGNPNKTIISESGLYALILRSRKAVTPGTLQHRFRKWITAEVIPALRKTGAYRSQPAPARRSSAEVDLLRDLAVTRQRLLDTQSRLYDELQDKQARTAQMRVVESLVRHSTLTDPEIAAESGEQEAYVAYVRRLYAEAAPDQRKSA